MGDKNIPEFSPTEVIKCRRASRRAKKIEFTSIVTEQDEDVKNKRDDEVFSMLKYGGEASSTSSATNIINSLLCSHDTNGSPALGIETIADNQEIIEDMEKHSIDVFQELNLSCTSYDELIIIEDEKDKETYNDLKENSFVVNSVKTEHREIINKSKSLNLNEYDSDNSIENLEMKSLKINGFQTCCPFCFKHFNTKVFHVSTLALEIKIY